MSRKGIIWLIAVLAVIGLGFLVWAAFGKGPQADSKTIGYDVVDATRTTVDFQVTKDPGAAAKCELKALDDSFGVVGWKLVDVPATADGAPSTVHQEPLNTDAKAVSAVVDSCWIE